MPKRLSEPREGHNRPPERRLIRRKRLVANPRYVVAASPQTMTRYVRPPPEDRVYSLVGQIAMEWTLLEQILDGCIAQLADAHATVTACFTAQMIGHVPRCLTIKALARYRGLIEIEQSAEQLKNVLSEAAELRNRAVHDRVLVESKSKSHFKDHRISKRELKFGLKEIDLGTLEVAIDLIKRRQ